MISSKRLRKPHPSRFRLCHGKRAVGTSTAMRLSPCYPTAQSIFEVRQKSSNFPSSSRRWYSWFTHSYHGRSHLIHGASFRDVTVGAPTTQDLQPAFSRAPSSNLHRSPVTSQPVPSPFAVLLSSFHSLPPAAGSQVIASLPSQLHFLGPITSIAQLPLKFSQPR